MPSVRLQILDAMPGHPATATPAMLAESLGANPGTVRNTMTRMVDRGELEKGDEYGEYRLPRPVVVPQETPPAYPASSHADDTETVIECYGPGGVILRFRLVAERVSGPVTFGLRTGA